MHAGASLRCLEQPYLDIGSGKNWKRSIVSQLNTMVRAEGITANRLCTVMELTDKGRNYVSRCIVDMSIIILQRHILQMEFYIVVAEWLGVLLLPI